MSMIYYHGKIDRNSDYEILLRYFGLFLTDAIRHKNYIKLKFKCSFRISTRRYFLFQAFGPAQDNLLEVDLSTLTPQQCEDDMTRFVIETNARAPALDTSIEICTFHAPGSGVCQVSRYP